MSEFHPQDPDWQTRLRASFAAQAMMKTLDARLDTLAPGVVRVVSSIPDAARQHNGVGHAGLSFSIGDSAAGYAALSLMPPDHDVLSAELKINLMAPATGDRLVAEGRVLRPGRRLYTVMAEIWAETGTDRRQVAVMTGTMVPIALRKDQT